MNTERAAAREKAKADHAVARAPSVVESMLQGLGIVEEEPEPEPGPPKFVETNRMKRGRSTRLGSVDRGFITKIQLEEAEQREAEEMRRLRERFDEIDVDKSGEIDREVYFKSAPFCVLCYPHNLVPSYPHPVACHAGIRAAAERYPWGQNAPLFTARETLYPGRSGRERHH